MPDGSWRFRTCSNDKDGNFSKWSDSWMLTIDTTIKHSNDFQALDDVGTVQPVLPSQTTDDPRLDFSGQSELYSVVTLFQNGAAVGSTQTAADGQLAY